MKTPSGFTRRSAIKAAALAPAFVLVGRGFSPGETWGFSPGETPRFSPGETPQAQKKESGEQEVSTVEDLMREHGVLRR